MICPQVYVSDKGIEGTVINKAKLLGEYAGFMPLDQKFDIIDKTGFKRGRWITILDEYETKSKSTQRDHSLTLAEVRVYGGKGRAQKKTWYNVGIIPKLGGRGV